MISKNCSCSTSNKALLILFFSLIALAAILGLVYCLNSNSSPVKMAKGEDLYAKGYKAAREFAYQSGIPNMPIANVSGVIQTVSGNSLTVKTDLFIDEKVDGVGQVRTVNVASETKIVRRTEKDPAALMKELDAFDSRASGSDGMMSPPEPFNEESISLLDLKVGDNIIIMSGVEDVRLVNPIEAKEISLFVQREIVPPPAMEDIAPVIPQEVPVVTEPEIIPPVEETLEEMPVTEEVE